MQLINKQYENNNNMQTPNKCKNANFSKFNNRCSVLVQWIGDLSYIPKAWRWRHITAKWRWWRRKNLWRHMSATPALSYYDLKSMITPLVGPAIDAVISLIAIPAD